MQAGDGKEVEKVEKEIDVPQTVVIGENIGDNRRIRTRKLPARFAPDEDSKIKRRIFVGGLPLSVRWLLLEIWSLLLEHISKIIILDIRNELFENHSFLMN